MWTYFLILENIPKSTKQTDNPKMTADPSGGYVDFDNLQKEEKEKYLEYWHFHHQILDYKFDSIENSQSEDEKNPQFKDFKDIKDLDDDIIVQNLKDVPPKIVGFDPFRCMTGYQTFKIFVEETTWLSAFCIIDKIFIPATISTLHNYECSYKIRKEGKFNISFAQNKDVPSDKWIPVGILRVKGKSQNPFDLTTFVIILGFLLFIAFSIYFAFQAQKKQNRERDELPY